MTEALNVFEKENIRGDGGNTQAKSNVRGNRVLSDMGSFYTSSNSFVQNKKKLDIHGGLDSKKNCIFDDCSYFL